MIFHIVFWWCTQVHNEFKEHERKFQLLDSEGHEINVLKISTWLFYIWVLNTTTKVIMRKKPNLNNTLLLLLGLWPKKFMVLVDQSTYWVMLEREDMLKAE